MSTEAKRISAAKWYAKNKETVSKKRKVYYAAHRAREISRSAEYHKAHPKASVTAALKYHKAHPEVQRAASAKWKEKNPEARKAADLKWIEARPGYATNRDRARKEKKAGRPRPKLCEVCGLGGRICFDHDHVTGEFRGWICYHCNIVLGYARDSSDTLCKLAKYLVKARSAK